MRSDAEGFTLKNLSNNQRCFEVDLSALGENPLAITLAPQEQAHWVRER